MQGLSYFLFCPLLWLLLKLWNPSMISSRIHGLLLAKFCMYSKTSLTLSESMDLSWKHYPLKWWLLYISTRLPNRNLKLTHASKDEFLTTFKSIFLRSFSNGQSKTLELSFLLSFSVILPPNCQHNYVGTIYKTYPESDHVPSSLIISLAQAIISFSDFCNISLRALSSLTLAPLSILPTQ